MRKVIVCLVIILCSCNKKSYGLLNDSQARLIPFQDNKLFEKLDLDNYDYYKREMYYHFNGTNFIKTPEPITAGKHNRRYEIQIMAIEKTAVKDKNVFYFSYIPPYKPSSKDEYAYEMAPYDDFNIVNLNDINYIQFGKLNCANQITFIRDQSISLWSLSFNLDIPAVTIDKLVFLDRGKIKSVNTFDYFHNKSTYKKISAPDVLLHYYPGEPISPECTDYLIECLLYYDLDKNDIYFHFEDYLDDKHNTWIKYSHKRLRAKYVP